jgi:hypothetical protein
VYVQLPNPSKLQQALPVPAFTAGVTKTVCTAWLLRSAAGRTLGKQCGSLCCVRPLHMVVLLNLNTEKTRVLICTPADQHTGNQVAQHQKISLPSWLHPLECCYLIYNQVAHMSAFGHWCPVSVACAAYSYKAESLQLSQTCVLTMLHQHCSQQVCCCLHPAAALPQLC